jgi:DNA replication ATP-dependent helicase/nuclease Dna2
MQAPTSPFRLTPSAVARYFFLDCDRYLRYWAAPDFERMSGAVPERTFDHSPLMQAVLESGLSWEEKVVQQLLVGRVLIAPGEGPLSERRFTAPATVERLRTEPVGRFLYQATLRAPQQFYDAYGLDPARVALGDWHPDLIEVREDPDGERLLRVIDVKRGDSLQLGYRVQVLLYALALEAVLANAGISGVRADLQTGAVWLGEQLEPETFDMRPLRPHLEQFLRRVQIDLFDKPPQAAFWHVSFNCERCSYYESCRQEMQQTEDISQLTNLTTHGKKHLVQLGIRTRPQLASFLARPDADRELSLCASLAGERHYLEGRLTAFRDGRPQSHGSATVLPVGENVAVFLILQREPLGRRTYLAGLLVHAKTETVGIFSPEVRTLLFDAAGKPQPHVLIAEQPADVPAIRGRFLRLLYQVLLDVHRANVGRDWTEQRSLQVYAHTDRDQEQLTAWLLEGLREPDLSVPAMDLLLYFQGPDLILTDEHPGQPVPFPVVVLQNALTKLLALPVEVSYTLPETIQALGSKYPYPRKDYYHYPLGHGLRSEAIHAAWHLSRPGQIDGLRKEARAYLFALRGLLWELREQVRGQLFFWPPRFQLPARALIEDPILSRLAFFTRYESVVQCLTLRGQRLEPVVVQRQLGLMAELEARNGGEFVVIGEPVLEIGEGGFPSWLLARDSAEGRRAQLEFRDYASRNKLYARKSPHLALVGVEQVETDAEDFPRRLWLKYATDFDGAPPQPGERFQLHPRFTDFNSDRVIEYLQELDKAGGGLFVPLVRDPLSAARVRPLLPPVEAAASTREVQLGLTDSQRLTYQEIRRRRLVAVWGPPGTGKTHFLAAAILGLADAYASVGKLFRVLITAFTHAAIENLLRKIDELKEAIPGLGATVEIGKVKAWHGEQGQVGTVIAEDKMALWLGRRPQAVAGATVYSCIKAAKKGELPAFDLVIVDEASQVRVGEASVPVSLVGPEGRLVLAGDDLQLPPIVQGIYPEVEAGEPMLHRSIFEAIRSRVSVDSPIVCKLLENRRMNNVLTSFAAELLYGRDYHCFDASVASRRLRLGPPLPAGLCAACLDPAYPMVAVVIEGARATGENTVEASIIADLVMALRDSLRDETDQLYSEDSHFFERGVFIVSPHRAQIRAIRRELNRRRKWDAPPFVDTVDKMQGQEADAVIISYGVSDPEYALLEAEFIYSVNRLNVSITRARCKSIVCLPRPLLDGMPRVLESPDAARGLAFMQNIVQEAEKQEAVCEFDIVKGVHARVLRADRSIVTT